MKLDAVGGIYLYLAKLFLTLKKTNILWGKDFFKFRRQTTNQ
jgi:hypothetical protein